MARAKLGEIKKIHQVKIQKKYHHLTQGTRTLPVPYDWFINIEQASSSLLLMPFTSEKKFVDNDYLLKLGFIRSQKIPSIP